MSYIQLLLLLSGLVFLECTSGRQVLAAGSEPGHRLAREPAGMRGGEVSTQPMLRWETRLIDERKRNATAPKRISKRKPCNFASVVIFFFSIYIMYLALVLF